MEPRLEFQGPDQSLLYTLGRPPSGVTNSKSPMEETNITLASLDLVQWGGADDPSFTEGLCFGPSCMAFTGRCKLLALFIYFIGLSVLDFS